MRDLTLKLYICAVLNCIFMQIGGAEELLFLPLIAQQMETSLMRSEGRMWHHFCVQISKNLVFELRLQTLWLGKHQGESSQFF